MGGFRGGLRAGFKGGGLRGGLRGSLRGGFKGRLKVELEGAHEKGLVLEEGRAQRGLREVLRRQLLGAVFRGEA